MFNVVINNEQYNEYLAQKEKIKELETRNEFLKEKFDSLNECYQQVLSDNDAFIKECDRLTNVVHVQGSDIVALNAKIYDLKENNEKLDGQVDHWKEQFDSLYDNYHQALSEKDALIKARNEYKDLYMKQTIKCNELRFENDKARKELESIKNQDKMIETLQSKIAYYDNKDIRFKELNSENYRLQMSNNDLKENNKALKAEKKALLLECNRLDKELESIKSKIKEPVASVTITPCDDSEEAYSPDRNTIIDIKNLYITNNYFSEEDENNE